MDEKKLYKYDENIAFRKCTLFEHGDHFYGDCTKFDISQISFKDYYECNQYGIHFHCSKHFALELDWLIEDEQLYLCCPKCKNKIAVDNRLQLIQKCLSMVNAEIFKDAKLVRLDDWYVPEIKGNKEKVSDYWVKTEVKTDKDGDTMIVIYVGNKNTDEKAQLFIKPEKLQLSNDYKDMDPATVLSKIELTLKDRVIIQKYNTEI